MKAQHLRNFIALPSRYQIAALLSCAIAFCCVAVSAVQADDLSFATSQIDSELLERLERRGDLTLREMSLPDALLTISETWNVNIVVGNDVAGQVSGTFRDTSLKGLLSAILESNGYSYRPVGRNLVVQRASDEDSISPFFQTATIPIEIADPAELVEGARLLASSNGRIQAITSANSLLVFDTAERITVIRRFVAQMDRAARQAAANSASGASALETIHFAPQFVDVDALREVVQSLVSADGKVGAMEHENRLVVVDYPGNLELIRQTIQKLDVPRPQVRITALIYDLSLEDIERLGINWSTATKWGSDSNGEPTGLLGIDSVMQIPAAATDPSSAVTLMNLSEHIDMTGVIEALKQLTEARLLADPTVTVIDREKATIQIVTEIPYQQLTQTGNGGNIGTTAFREAGVKLNVSPKIANDGTLQLDVTPTFSRLAGFTQGANPAPIIDKREASTTVRVVHGQTLVIGGLRQRSDTHQRRGVPYLQDKKYFGRLFRARSDTVRESELVVFITPEILMPNCDCSRPRECEAAALARGELERIPVAPDMMWPNPYCGLGRNKGCFEAHDVYRRGDRFYGGFEHGHPTEELVFPEVESEDLTTPEMEAEGAFVPELGSASARRPLRHTPTIAGTERRAPLLRRLPHINSEIRRAQNFPRDAVRRE